MNIKGWRNKLKNESMEKISIFQIKNMHLKVLFDTPNGELRRFLFKYKSCLFYLRNKNGKVGINE